MSKYALFGSRKITLATAERLSIDAVEGYHNVKVERLNPKQRAWFDRPRHCDRFMRVGGRSWSCPCGFSRLRFPKFSNSPLSEDEKRDRRLLRLSAKKARFKANREAADQFRKTRPES